MELEVFSFGARLKQFSFLPEFLRQSMRGCRGISGFPLEFAFVPNTFTVFLDPASGHIIPSLMTADSTESMPASLRAIRSITALTPFGVAATAQRKGNLVGDATNPWYFSAPVLGSTSSQVPTMLKR
jgi:hypothetical protein